MHLRIFALTMLIAVALAFPVGFESTATIRAQSSPPPPPNALAPTQSGPAQRTGNVIVRFKPGASLTAVAAAVTSSGSSVQRAPAGAGTVVVHPAAGQSVDDVVAALNTSPNVEYAEADLTVSKAVTPNDSYYGPYQWNLPQIGADTAWNTTTGSAAVTVAVVDTGVDGTHPDLTGKLVAGKNFINIPIASSTNAGGLVRINTTAPHPYLSGQQIVISGHNVAAVNGTWSIFAPRTNITLSSNNGGFVQITTSAAHGLTAGEMVNITGHSIPACLPCENAVNGHHTVVSTPSSTTFTIETAYGGTNGSASGAANEASWFNLVGSGYGGVIGSASGTANEPTAKDDDSHGTFVASIIAANTNNTEGMAGVCWSCKILPVKVLDDTGNGNTADVAAGIIWAADNGAKVINLSLGSASGNATLQNAVDYAWNTKNAVVVAATGNDNGPVLFPAAYDNALAVGANNPAGFRSSFSNFGPSIDLMAPGEGVLGALCACNGYGGGYGLGDGTSFASPHVAGVVGLLIAAGTTDKNTIVNRLKTTATDMDVVAGFDNNTGWGRISASLALGDVTPPTVSITSPANGATVSGASVPFNATAADAGGVQKVRFWVDNLYLSFDSTAPYGKVWDTTTYSNGAHTLKVEALDTANNSTITTISVNVNNIDSTPPAVSITAPANGASVSGSLAFNAAASDAGGMQKVRFWVDNLYLGFDATAPYSKTLDTNSLSNGPHTLKVEALDLSNNPTVRTISVTVANTDATPPAVSITAPADGATVSGSGVTFNASASDAGGIQKLRFWVDNLYLGFDSSVPYSKTWDTTLYSNGAHTLKVEALDWANNSTITTITVTVAN